MIVITKSIHAIDLGWIDFRKIKRIEMTSGPSESTTGGAKREMRHLKEIRSHTEVLGSAVEALDSQALTQRLHNLVLNALVTFSAALSCVATLLLMGEALAQAPAGQSASGKAGEVRSKTQLETRLQPLEAQIAMPPSDKYWNDRAKIIEKSDPDADAGMDASNGIVGFMTALNTGWGNKPYAPGLRCPDRHTIKKYSVFSDSHGDALSKTEWQASKSYYTYAWKYNHSNALSNLIKKTKCKIENRITIEEIQKYKK